MTFGLEYILIKVGRLELRIKGSGSSISILINLPNQQNTHKLYLRNATTIPGILALWNSKIQMQWVMGPTFPPSSWFKIIYSI